MEIVRSFPNLKKFSIVFLFMHLTQKFIYHSCSNYNTAYAIFHKTLSLLLFIHQLNVLSVHTRENFIHIPFQQGIYYPIGITIIIQSQQTIAYANTSHSCSLSCNNAILYRKDYFQHSKSNEEYTGASSRTRQFLGDIHIFFAANKNISGEGLP